MVSYRKISGSVSVAPQFALADVADVAASGIRRVVNNRPDGEDPDQPTSAEMEQAVRAAGMDYVHAPIAGMPGTEAIRAVAAALETEEAVLMYCRSGTRSAIVWALAMRSLDRADADSLRVAAAAAGYDLSRLPL